MTAYLPTLSLAIRTRLTADTTLTALVANPTTSFNMGPGLDEAPLPLVHFNFLPPTSNDAFRMSSDEILLDLHVYAERRPGANPPVVYSDAYTHAATICERICGDWHAQTYPTGPTFGLDRWRPDLSAVGWSATTMQVVSRMREVSDMGDEILHFVVEFRLFVSRLAV
jgi:hypothetical protein